MKKLHTYILTILMLFNLTICWGNDYSSVLGLLQSNLDEREFYFERQEKLIKEAEEKLLTSSDKLERFEVCYSIFNLSRSYKYDIAYKYSNEALNLAHEIGDSTLILQAMACKLSAYTSGGLFTESSEVLKCASTSGVKKEVKREYFYNVVRYYSDQRDYASRSQLRERYTKKLVSYADSIIELSEKPDYYFTYATYYKESTLGNTQKGIDALLAFYGNIECSHHHNSIITFLLGVGYFELGDQKAGFDYLSKSMYHDVRAAARENRSIKTLSQHLFENGEEKLSEKLINVAFEDAKFYNARHRNLEINSLLPIINEHKIATIKRQRNILYAMIALISLLTIGAVVAMFVLKKTAAKLALSQRTIKQQFEALTEANSQLRVSNSNKELYIIESLHKKHRHLKKIELLLKKIDIKVKNRLYEDLISIYKDFNIKHERDNFFAEFDMAFIKLFPTFIEEYNSLFEPKDQICVEESESLPPEVRIFVLMRLGIVENERISQFLDLSINTIYTYKTKVKGRAIVPKEEFEDRILKIKLYASEE